MSWAMGLEASLVATSILALVILGISVMRLYKPPPASKGTSCHGDTAFPSLLGISCVESTIAREAL